MNKITDKRFKTNQISLMFHTNYDEISRSDYATAAYILTDCCKKFPTYSAMSKRLAELYDASLNSSTSLGTWDTRCTIVQASILADCYALEGEKLEEEMCELLCECVLNPNADNGAFDEQVTSLMRSELIDTIDSVINDKAAYAAKNAAQTAFVGEPQALSPNGTHEQAEKVTPQSAYKAYRKILETAHIEIMCAGSSDFSAAETIFTRSFSEDNGIKRHDICELSIAPSPLKSEPSYVSDTIPMEQAIVRMYFKAPDVSDKYANMMFVMILGGMTMSRFFMNIREKQSLCYYCAATGSFYKQYICAYAGVEPQNIKRTQDAIISEINDIAQNGVSPEEMSAAFLEIHNSLATLYDSANAIGKWYLNRLLDDKITTPEEYWEEVQKVTSERIQAVAKQYKLDTVYTLSGGDGE